MSTSLRNKFLTSFGLALLLIGWGVREISAAPLAHVTAAVNIVSAPYVAGVSTNSVFIFFDGGSPGQAPDAGATITLSVLDENGNTVSNGLNNTSFTTDGVSSSYGGSVNPFVFYKSGTIQLKATASGVTASTSNSFQVSTGAASKLIVLAPGETLLPGRNPSVVTLGKSGNPSVEVVNSTFAITVQLTDAQYNPVSGVNNVTLTGGSFSTISPASQNLVAGLATFSVGITAPKVTETFTASSSGLTSGSSNVTSAGPESEKVAAFPSPFNPHTGSVNFQFVVDTAKSVTLKITDQFGQQVWEKTTTGLPNTLNIQTWDGRNDRGTIVAAGAYYVLLEVDGKLKSKKKFGVIK